MNEEEEREKCRKKRKWKTRQKARCAIARARHDGIILKAYNCKWCGKIHVTSNTTNRHSEIRLVKLPLSGEILGSKIQRSGKAIGFLLDMTAQAWRRAPEYRLWLPAGQIADLVETETHATFQLPDWLVVDKDLELFIDVQKEKNGMSERALSPDTRESHTVATNGESKCRCGRELREHYFKAVNDQIISRGASTDGKCPAYRPIAQGENDV